ncbi:MAG TPA: CpsD/CapB family tyrosine-protein kinase [Rhodanobacteraceae bacterium]|nr:CpsD/CapB family tyrosine-protein kinase [Rhodanobacteraceae bacterium]
MNAIESPHLDLRRLDQPPLDRPQPLPGAAPTQAPLARELSVRELEARKLIHRDTSSRASTDAFRQIRTRLLALAGEQNVATLVVPVSPRSGASFVARNLAAAFALSETMSALLIDCSVRHPAQQSALGIHADRGGLMDYLDDPERSIDDIIYPTGVPRLQLVPAGHPRELPGEQFSSLRMQALIDSLRSSFQHRYLILDGPAIEGSPDARILSQLVDQVIVVARYGRDTPAVIAAATAQFEAQKMAGVVFDSAP